ncbi:MAG: archease [Nanoarchaeota archaeon]
MENKKYSKKFKFLEHTADVKFQAFGKNVEEVFENSALALKETICGKIKIKGIKEKKIIVEGKDFESLLYNFLEEIIYLLDAEDFLIKEIKSTKIDGFKLKATIIGDKASNYKFTNNVKAVTYNEMFVKKNWKKWTAQVVIDV